MTLFLDLTPTEEARPTQSDDPMLALFAQWDQEDALMTLEEQEAERADWEQFKKNINAERDRAGARRVF